MKSTYLYIFLGIYSESLVMATHSSKGAKISPVLPPDQRLKLKGRLKDKQLFWNSKGSKCIYLKYLLLFNNYIFLLLFLKYMLN